MASRRRREGHAAYFLGSEHRDLHGCLTPADFVPEVDKTIICRRTSTAMVVQWLDFKRGWYREVRGGASYTDVLATLAQVAPDVALSAGKDRVASALRGCSDPDTGGGNGIQIAWHCASPGKGTDVTFMMAESGAVARRHARDLLPTGRPRVKNKCEPTRPVSDTRVGHTGWAWDDEFSRGPFWCFLDGLSPVYVWVDNYHGVTYMARQSGSNSTARRWSTLEDSWSNLDFP